MTDAPQPRGALFNLLLSLACGAMGGLLALALYSPTQVPAADGAGLKDLTEQIAALRVAVEASRKAAPLDQGQALRAIAPDVALPPRPALVVPPLPASIDSGFAQESVAAFRERFEARQLERHLEETEVDLVKLRNAQKNISPDQTRQNVIFHLRRLQLAEPEVAAAAEACAPYVKERTDAVIKILEQVMNDTKKTPSEIAEDLRPLDEKLSKALPAGLDDANRRAIVSEMRTMARVPYFLTR